MGRYFFTMATKYACGPFGATLAGIADRIRNDTGESAGQPAMAQAGAIDAESIMATADAREDELGRLGLTRARFLVMLALSEFEPLPREMLARLLVRPACDVDHDLAPLIEFGVVTIAEGTVSGGLVLTRAGRDLLARALPVWENAR